MLPTKDPPQNKRPAQTENEGMEKNIPSKWTGKEKAGLAMLTSDKTDFRTKAIKRDPEGHLLHNTEGGNPSGRMNIVNMYAPNIGAPKYIKNMLGDFKK